MTAFNVSPRFCFVVFSFSFNYRNFISSLISSLTHSFFSNELFYLHESVFTKDMFGDNFKFYHSAVRQDTQLFHSFFNCENLIFVLRCGLFQRNFCEMMSKVCFIWSSSGILYRYLFSLFDVQCHLILIFFSVQPILSSLGPTSSCLSQYGHSRLHYNPWLDFCQEALYQLLTHRPLRCHIQPLHAEASCT